MKLEQLQSGLAIPEQKPTMPERKYGPLELHTDQQEAHKDFTKLLNLSEVRGRPSELATEVNSRSGAGAVG